LSNGRIRQARTDSYAIPGKNRSARVVTRATVDVGGRAAQGRLSEYGGIWVARPVCWFQSADVAWHRPGTGCLVRTRSSSCRACARAAA